MKWNQTIAMETAGLLNGLMATISEQLPEFFKAMLVKSFTAGETGIHPKMVADWNKMGLLVSPRVKNKHHRLTLTEFVWLLTLERMKDFHLNYDIVSKFHSEFVVAEQIDLFAVMRSPEGMEMIAKTMGEEGKALMEAVLSDKAHQKFMEQIAPPISAFHSMVIAAFLLEGPMCILLDKAGNAKFYCPELVKDHPILRDSMADALIGTHFSLNLSDIIAQALGKAPMEKVSEKLRLLSPEEAAVIEALRTQRLKSVTIRLNDGGEVDFLELTTVEHADRGTKLLELMVHEGYHEIRVKTEKGKVVYCENIRKIKLK
jgi:DNA-binding transcriptional MerR regulator